MAGSHTHTHSHTPPRPNDNNTNTNANSHTTTTQHQGWRLFQLNKATADPRHPYHKFGSGNLETLRPRPEEGRDTREVNMWTTGLISVQGGGAGHARGGWV